jgi:hypothetical protein
MDHSGTLSTHSAEEKTSVELSHALCGPIADPPVQKISLSLMLNGKLSIPVSLLQDSKYLIWNIYYLEYLLFGISIIWNIYYLEYLLFGISIIWNIYNLEYLLLGMLVIWNTLILY